MSKIIVVEGKNDFNKIKSVYPSLDVVTTNGSAVTEEFLDMLEKLSKDNEIVLFLDPDGPGEKIRNSIKERIPSASHIFAPKKESISKNKRKIGVEHLSRKNIIKCFENIHITKDKKTEINIIDLFDLGLISGESASRKREYLCNILKLGRSNGKRLKERLEMFGISINEVKEILNEKYH